MTNQEGNPNDSVKTSWLYVVISSPIVVYLALPIVLLTFMAINNFRDNFVTYILLGLVVLDVLVFFYLCIFKPENLTFDKHANLAWKKLQAKGKTGSVK